MILLLFIMVLSSLAVACFSWQVTISELSNSIKNALYLHQVYRLKPLCTFQFWTKFISPMWIIILSPLILILVALFNIHRFISKLLACPYCQSVWYMLALNYFMFHIPLMMSLLFSMLPLFWVHVIDKLSRIE